MHRPIIVVGFGGHGRVVASALQACGQTVIAFTAHAPQSASSPKSQLEVLTDDVVLERFPPSSVRLALGIGSVSPSHPADRRYVSVAFFEQRGYEFVGLQHPTAWIAPEANVSPTAQIHAGAIVQTGAVVGDFSIVNTRASVDHDCWIEAHCHIGPGATMSGNVSVGTGSHLGTGCNVIQGIRIGAHAFVAAGATVVKDIPNDVQVRGVPANPFGRAGAYFRQEGTSR